MYIPQNSFILQKNANDVLTNFYIDNSFDKEFLADMVETWRSSVNLLGDLYSQIVRNTDPVSAEIYRIIPFFKIIIKKSIYSASDFVGWEQMKFYEQLIFLKDRGYFESLNAARLWDDKDPDIIGADIYLTIDSSTAKPAIKLISIIDYNIFENNLFFTETGINKIRSVCKRENDGYIIYLANIAVNYEKIEHLYSSSFNVKNDYALSSHAFRNMVASLLNIAVHGMKIYLIQDVFSGVLNWANLEIIDFYNADEEQKKYWDGVVRNRFDFVVRALASRETGRDYNKINIVQRMLSAVKLSHTNFDIVIFTRDMQLFNHTDKIQLNTYLTDEDIKNFDDQTNIYRGPEIICYTKGFSDLNIISTTNRLASDNLAKGESVEILGAYHEQAYFQKDEISVNQKIPFTLDSGFSLFLDEQEHEHNYLDKSEIVIGYGDYIEVRYYG